MHSRREILRLLLQGIAGILVGCGRLGGGSRNGTGAASVEPASSRPPQPSAGSPAASQQPRDAGDDQFVPLPAPGPNDWLANHPEPGQTFEQFIRSEPNLPRGKTRTIYLQPIGRFSLRAAPDLGALRDYVARFYCLPVHLRPPLHRKRLKVTSRVNSFTEQRQLLAGDLLDELEKRLPGDAYCLLGMTMEDLYPHPSWNFVFGMARLKRRVGVYSFVRYHPSFRGEPVREGADHTVLRRSLKIAVHEIGHMFGLAHCTKHMCCMNGSNHLAESDSRPMHACPECLRKLQHSIEFDPVSRYERLREFYAKHGFADEAAWVEVRVERIRRSARQE